MLNLLNLVITGLIFVFIYLQFKNLEQNLNLNAQENLHKLKEAINQNQNAIQQIITQTLTQQMLDVRSQLSHSFDQHAKTISTHLTALTEEIRHHLQQLTQNVSHKLSEGFEKTSSTFIDIVKRLAIIDEAQKKITELSTHVVDLQDILVDKRSRGAFGEIQLANVVSNMMPPNSYSLQYTLSNQKRADCILFLPKPTGNIVIDAKFPLENYQKLMNPNENPQNKKALQQQFRQDLKKHIKDVAEKYIVTNETADSAILFIPAEAIFAEIHANYHDIVTLSHQSKVWLVSPSTLMAVLTTASAVLKDDATRKQVHIIQEHLRALAEDFQRFEKRMDKLTKHIDLAQQDALEVNTSAKKISQRFMRIEAVDLEQKQIEQEG